MIGLTYNLNLHLTCPVCGQERDEDAAKDTATLVVLFGVRRYAVCCCCGQEVLGTDANYRARWNRWAKKHHPAPKEQP